MNRDILKRIIARRHAALCNFSRRYTKTFSRKGNMNAGMPVNFGSLYAHGVLNLNSSINTGMTSLMNRINSGKANNGESLFLGKATKHNGISYKDILEALNSDDENVRSNMISAMSAPDIEEFSQDFKAVTGHEHPTLFNTFRAMLTPEYTRGSSFSPSYMPMHDRVLEAVGGDPNSRELTDKLRRSIQLSQEARGKDNDSFMGENAYGEAVRKGTESGRVDPGDVTKLETDISNANIIANRLAQPTVTNRGGLYMPNIPKENAPFDMSDEFVDQHGRIIPTKYHSGAVKALAGLTPDISNRHVNSSALSKRSDSGRLKDLSVYKLENIDKSR